MRAQPNAVKRGAAMTSLSAHRHGMYGAWCDGCFISNNQHVNASFAGEFATRTVIGMSLAHGEMTRGPGLCMSLGRARLASVGLTQSRGRPSDTSLQVVDAAEQLSGLGLPVMPDQERGVGL